MSDVSDQRRYYERMMDDIAIEHQRQLDALTAENTKLRELLRDMWHEGAFAPGACCLPDTGRLEKRTRDLGIELDW